MIVHVATWRGLHTVRRSLPEMPEDLRRRFRFASYDALMRCSWLPAATYIFSDIERLSQRDAHRAAVVWHALADSGHPVRLLNHPMRSLRRHQLLRNLFQAGINSFNVHRASRPGSTIRYPVFLRNVDDHRGARTGLIGDPAELAAELERLEAGGMRRQEILIVEFCDTRDQRGVYRKYDAFVAGDHIVPTDIYFSSNWMLKWRSDHVFDGVSAPDEEDLVAERLEYLRAFPQRDELRRVCALARIEYGRIDFSLQGGRIQVWEINTNPDLALTDVFSSRFVGTPYRDRVVPAVMDVTFEMLRSLDLQPDPRIRIPIDLAGPMRTHAPGPPLPE